MLKIKYKGDPCIFTLEHYRTGNYALLLMSDDEFPEPYSTCTTNIPGLKENEIAIKDWSENEGMYEYLLLNKIIKPFHREERSGYVSIPICYFQEGIIETIES